MFSFIRRIINVIINFFRSLFSKGGSGTSNKPSLRFLAPVSDITAKQIIIEYEIIDQNSLATNLFLKFSIGSNIPRDASGLLNDPRHEGKNSLSSSPSGVKHVFIWDWQQDTTGNSISDVRIYLEAENGNGRSAIVNSPPIKISKPALGPSPTAPRVSITSPTTDITVEDLKIDFIISDQESNLADIRVLFSHRGSTFSNATAKSQDPRHSGVSALSTSPGGLPYSFIWKWQDDIQQNPADDVEIKIIASDLSGNGIEELSNKIKITKPTIPPHPPANLPPRVGIIGPFTNVSGANILTEYILSDPDENPADISLEFSINGGNFSLATELNSDSRHEGVSALTTNKNGIKHSFVWDWQNDINSSTASAVVLRIVARNQHGNSAPALSNSFDITGSTGPVPTTNIRPHIQIVEPSLAKIVGPDLLIVFDLFDSDNNPSDLLVEYSNGGIFETATAKSQDPRHNGTTALNSSATGERHQFVWDWYRDINQNEVSNVIIRMTANDSQGYGQASTTMPMTLYLNQPSSPGPSPVPEIFILSPYEDIDQATEIPILLRCLDETSEAVDIELFYSLDGGAFSAITPKTSDPRHNGNTGLITSPGGETHIFVWDFQADIPGATNSYFQLEARASNSRGNSQAGLSRFFRMIQPLSPATSNVQFSVNIDNTMTSISGNDHLIEFTVIEPNSELADVEVKYSVGGGNFELATPINNDPRHSGNTGLATSPDGEPFGYLWDWLADIGSDKATDVVIQVKVTLSSGISVSSQTSSVDISVTEQDYQFSILSGNNIEACPSLRLPAGTIQLELKNHGAKAPLKEVSVFVTEGGGGFPEQRPPADEQLRSHIQLNTDINGKLSLPEFILGSRPSPNRLIIQSDHCQTTINILGTYNNTQIIAIEPASAQAKEVVTVVSTFCAQIQDTNYPMAAIKDVPILIEMTSGGGWLRMDQGFGRSAILETNDNYLVSLGRSVHSSILFSCMFSSRVETTNINLSLRDYPSGPKLSLTMETKKLHMLSYRVGTTGNEHLNNSANNFLSPVSRWATTDHDTATHGSPNVPVYGPFQLLAESSQGQSELIPEHRSGWGGNTSLMIRPTAAGNTAWKMTLPDFPDDNDHILSVQSVDRLSGSSLYTTRPPWFVETHNGGSRDDDNGLELQLVSGDQQYVGPNASAVHPWRINVITKRLQPADRRRLKDVKIYVKVRTAPASSEIDDPGYTGVKPGLVGLSPGSGVDELEISVPVNPGVNPLTLYFTSRDVNYDNFLELTAKVVVEEKDSNDIWHSYNRNSTIIARAMFFAPRFSVTQKRGSDFIEPAEESIIPSPVIDPAGNPLTINPDYEYYVEMRAQDYGSDVDVSVPGRAPIKLSKVKTNDIYTLYRSLPIVFYQENPNDFGIYQFTLPTNREYIRLSTPKWFYINGKDAISNNTNQANYWSPVRPYTFLNVATPDRQPLKPEVPKARIFPESVFKNDSEHNVLLENNKVKLQITGKIYDTIADFCPGNTANIDKIYVNGHDYTVNSVNETATEFRPYAWRGDFDIKVPLEPGIQVLEVRVINKLEKETIMQILIDLLDSRNDYEHPDISKMKAIVQILNEPERPDQNGFFSVNYRMPCSRRTMSIPPSVSVTINSIDKSPGVNIEDTLSLNLKSGGGKENIFSAIALAVPENVNQQGFNLLRNAGAAIIKHSKGNRLHIIGTMLPHIRGAVSLHNFISSADTEMRLLLKKPDGSFEEREQLKVGDEFTVEFRQLGPFSYSPVQLIVAACDRMGQILKGDNRILMIEADTGPNAGWLRMKSYLDTSGNTVSSTTIKISGENAPAASQGIAILRFFTHGTLRIGEFLGKKIRKRWPVLNNPIRQELNNEKIAHEPYHVHGSRDGAINSVVAATGEFVLNETDLILYSRNMDMAFERIYMSYNQYDGPMGISWNHSFNTWFTKIDDDHYQWISARAIIYDFKKDPNTGKFISPNGVFAKFSNIDDSICLLEWFGGVKQIFLRIGLNSNVWVLHTIYDRSFNRLRAIHNQNGLLTSASNAIKQKILLRYGDNHKIKIVSDETGRAFKYKYHEAPGQYGPKGNLKSVRTPLITASHNKYSNGKERHYDYFSDLTNLSKHNKLKAIQDGQGSLSRAGTNPISPVLLNDISSEGKVDKQHYGQGTYDFTYSQNQTVVSNRRNYNTEYKFASSNTNPQIQTLAIEASYPVRSGSDTFKYAYNDHGSLIRYETPLQTKIEYSYDTANQDPRNHRNVLEKKHYPRLGRPDKLINTVGITDFNNNPPESRPAFLLWKWTYESKYQKVKTIEDPLGLKSTYTYDYETTNIPQKHGNLYKLEETKISSGKHNQASADRITTWHYNNFGQEIKNISPLGIVTRYEYYPENNPKGALSTSTISDQETSTSNLAKIVNDDSDPSVNRSSLLTAVETATEQLIYDAWGNVKRHIEKNGSSILFKYNEIGQLIERRSPEGLIEQIWYNINNQVLRSSKLIRDINFPSGARRQTSRVVMLEFDYDRLGNTVTERVDPNGLNLKTTFEYDEEDNLIRVRSPKANRSSNPDINNYVEYEYDPQNRKSKMIQSPNSSPRWEKEIDYDEEGNVLITSETMSATTSRSLEMSFEYNSWGQQIATVDAYGNKKSQLYDALGRITYIARSGSVDGEYPVNQSRILNESIIFLNESGNKVANHAKVFHWKKQGANWQIENIDSGKMISSQEYDEGGNVVATVEANGHRTEHRYNGHGHVRASASVGNGESRAQYDLMGNVLSASIPSPSGGNETVLLRTYDNENRMITNHETGKEKEHAYYDTLGQLRLKIDGSGNRVYQEYDNTGRLIKVLREIRRGGRYQSSGSSGPNRLESEMIMNYEFDENDNAISIKDGNNNVVLSHTYDSRNERISTTLPDDSFPTLQRASTGTNTYQFTYWENSKIKDMTSPDGLVIHHSYDNAGRLKSRTVTQNSSATSSLYGTTSQTFKYDGANRCVYSSDNNGFNNKKIEVEHHYNSLNQIHIDRQFQDIITNHRDLKAEAAFRSNGEFALMQFPGNSVPNTRYVYNNSGRLSSIHDNLTNTKLVDINYNKHYQSERSVSNNHREMIQHNSQGIVERFMHFSTVAGTDSPAATVPGLNSGEKVVTAEEYVFNDSGHPYIVKDLKNNKASINFYDSLGRLTTVLGDIDGNDLSSRPNYGKWQHFDSHGNTMISSEGQITKETNNAYTVVNTTEFLRTYNLANQVGRSVESYVKNGLHQNTMHIHYDRRGNMISDHQYQYQYDAFNRLLAVLDKRNQRLIIRNYYDSFDRRIVKNNIRYLYYQNKIIEERFLWIKRFLHDENGVFMIETDMTANGGIRWRNFIHRDRGGNAVYMTSRSGEIREKYAHHPLTGLPSFLDVNDEEKTLGLGNPFLYQGMYYDDEIQLYCVGPRFYHPKFKMMMQRDPEGIDFDSNAYSFARNNPNSFMDPSGRLPFIIVLMITGFILGAGLMAVRQFMLYLDGEKNAFNIWEILAAGLFGAVMAPIAFVAPHMTGLVFGIAGAFSAVDEYEKGHYWTAAFDAIFAVLGLVGAVKGGTLVRAIHRHRLGPKAFDRFYPKKLSRTERAKLLFQEKEQVQARYAQMERENAERYFLFLIERVDRMARRVGIDPQDITFVWALINKSRMKGHPRVIFRTPNGQQGMKEMGGGYINERFYIELDYFLPRSIQARLTGIGANVPKNVASVRQEYPTIEALFLHEVGHRFRIQGGFGSGHGGGLYQDPSSLSIFNFFIQQNIISRSTVLQLAKSIRHLPTGAS